jgi:hypothetical protein
LGGKVDGAFFLAYYTAEGILDETRTQGMPPALTPFTGHYVSLDRQSRALWAGEGRGVSGSPYGYGLLRRLSFGLDPEPLYDISQMFSDPYYRGMATEEASDGGVFLLWNQSDPLLGETSRAVTRIGTPSWDSYRPGESVIPRQGSATIVPDPAGGVLWAGRTNWGVVYLRHIRRDGHQTWELESTDPQWWADAPRVVMDSAGNTLGTGVNRAGDFLTIKLDPTGAEIWRRTFDVGYGTDTPIALAVDSVGTAFVTGSSTGSNGDLDYATLAYDPAGKLLWARTFGGGGDEVPSGLAADAAGVVWVTGTAGNDALTVEYDSEGRLVLANRYPLPGPPEVAGVVARGGTATVALTAAGDIFTLRYGRPSGPTSFYTVAPCRAFDSRDGSNGGPDPLAGPSDRTLSLAGRCDIPDSALALSLNITVVGGTHAGNVTLFPAGNPAPPTSSINYAPGQTRANNITVATGLRAGLALRVSQNGGSVHVVIDVVGCWLPSSSQAPIFRTLR